MARPVTTSEVLLQQIADSLVEIRDLLQQPSTPDASGGPVEVRGQGEVTGAASPAPVTEPAAPKAPPRKRATSKRASAKKTRSTKPPVTGD